MGGDLGEIGREVKLGAKTSQVAGRQARGLGDTGQHLWSDFIAIMEGEYNIRPAIPRKRSMGARLALDGPA
jgi:hypothetical protein